MSIDQNASPPLLRTQCDGVLTLAMTETTVSIALGEALIGAIGEAATDPVVRAIVLTGAGDTFSAGGNVKQMADPSASAPRDDGALKAALMRTTAACLALADSPKPTMAVVNGACAGGGLGLAAACDLRIAGEGARFAFAYPHIGLGGDLAATWHLNRILGPAAARYFCLLAPRLTGAEALAIGLVSAVYPDAAIAQEGAKLAARLAGMAPIALAHVKANLDAAAMLPRAAAVELEADNFVRAYATQDRREATRAFVEKRRPVFHGR